MRLKLNETRSEDTSLPSQITEDEWAEITRYHQVKQVRHLKDEVERKQKQKEMIRNSLDNQVKQRHLTLEREGQEAKNWDTKILFKCKNELEQEKIDR